MECRVIRNNRTNSSLYHSGKKGMKWGFNDGAKNGRRTAASDTAVKSIENFRSKIGQGTKSALIGGMNTVGVDERQKLIKTQTQMKVNAANDKLLNKNDSKNNRKNRMLIKTLTDKYAQTPLGKLEKSKVVGKKITDALIERMLKRR